MEAKRIMSERTKSLYVDQPSWGEPINVDDFVITIGVKQSNSVYHVSEVKIKQHADKRITRYNLKVFDSDLMTAIQRDKTQKIIPIVWYKRSLSTTRQWNRKLTIMKIIAAIAEFIGRIWMKFHGELGLKDRKNGVLDVSPARKQDA